MDETHDLPTDDENERDHRSPFKTPRGQPRPRVNRIWTAGTPASHKRASGSTHEVGFPAPMRLPSLALSVSAGSLYAGSEDDRDEEDASWTVRDGDATPRASRFGGLKDKLVHNSGGKPGEVQQADRDEFDDDEDVLRETLSTHDSEASADIEDDSFEDELPSLTLKEILLCADASHFDLLGMLIRLSLMLVRYLMFFRI